MSDATVVALVILIGVFLLMAISIYKSGIEGAIKMWGVMGALTGVAFGSITSFYFTNKSNQQEIAQLRAENTSTVLAFNSALQSAAEAKKSIYKFSTMLGDEEFPKNISPTEKAALSRQVKLASKELQGIEDLGMKFKESNLIIQ